MSDGDFASPTGIKWQGNVGTVEYGGDRGQVAIFYNKPEHNPAKSTAAGRPIYEDTIYVRIHPPGERLNIVDKPADARDKARFPVQWAQFQENRQQIPEGTPIDLLYPNHPSIASMLKASGVFTIEQCADLSGPAIDNIGMGAQRYCNDAGKYLQASNKGVKASQLQHELEERDSQIRTLTSHVEMLTAQVNQLRDLNSQNVDLAQVQKLLAGQQTRPQYPQAARQLDRAFDAQSEQIAAVHSTRDIAAQRTQKSSKRARPRIQA